MFSSNMEQAIIRFHTFVGLLALSSSAVANPDIRMSCYNPQYTASVAAHGVTGGTATTGVIQFNINTPSSGPGVLVVNQNNGAVCEFSISDGYTVSGGSAIIDPNNIFTGLQPGYFGSAPAKDAIKSLIHLDWSPTPSGGKFVMPAVKSTTWLGTVNVTFTIRYTKDS